MRWKSKLHRCGWSVLLLVYRALPASSCSIALSTSAFSFPISSPGLGLSFAFQLLLTCPPQGIQQGLFGQEVCQLQLEADRQMATISFAPCNMFKLQGLVLELHLYSEPYNQKANIAPRQPCFKQDWRQTDRLTSCLKIQGLVEGSW